LKFCSACGKTVSLKVPELDDRERHVCDHCDTIHYQNPRIIVGCLPLWEDKVLLCKRAIEPRKHYWTLPAGFMENAETTQEGAVRETWEEAHARVSSPVLYTLFDLPDINQVYMFYRCELTGPEYGSGPESLEVELFDESEIPWTELAFPVIYETLKLYFSDRQSRVYPVHSIELRKDAWHRMRQPV